ncbi:MAG: hypothetical protein WCI30_06925 [Clostridia bacterium]
MKSKLKMGISIGGPTIIMIFVVLCLTTLGTLSLVTANADWKLTEKTLKSTDAYYTADNQGEIFLAELDALLLEENPLELLNKIPGTKAELNPEGLISVMHTIEISPAQNLLLEIIVPKLSTNIATTYQIIKWQVVNNTFWNYDDFEIQFNDTIPEN